LCVAIAKILSNKLRTFDTEHTVHFCVVFSTFLKKNKVSVLFFVTSEFQNKLYAAMECVEIGKWNKETQSL